MRPTNKIFMTLLLRIIVAAFSTCSLKTSVVSMANGDRIYSPPKLLRAHKILGV
jgi:hypothetical protein